MARIPEDLATIAVDTGIVDNDSKWRCAVGEVTPDYKDILFRKGFNGIIEDAEAKRRELDITLPENIGKSNFYRAVIICAEAAILLGKRYAQQAEMLAFQEKDPVRKKELIAIAQNCDRIPGAPPETFCRLFRWFGLSSWQTDCLKMPWHLTSAASTSSCILSFRKRL